MKFSSQIWTFILRTLSIIFVISKFHAVLAVDCIWVIQSSLDQVELCSDLTWNNVSNLGSRCLILRSNLLLASSFCLSKFCTGRVNFFDSTVLYSTKTSIVGLRLWLSYHQRSKVRSHPRPTPSLKKNVNMEWIKS